LIFNGLHGVISHKIVPFITTAVRISNPEENFVIYIRDHSKILLGQIPFNTIQTCDRKVNLLDCYGGYSAS
jgi:hypothetical protein